MKLIFFIFLFLGFAFLQVNKAQKVPTLNVGHKIRIECIAFSPSGKIIATGGYDGVIKLWDVRSGKEINTLKGHSSDVTSVSFSPDGKTIASGSEDKTIKLWDIKSGEIIKTFVGHEHTIEKLIFDPNNKKIISASERNVKVWDIQYGQEIKTIEGQCIYRNSLAFSPDGRKFVAVDRQNHINIWSIKSGKVIKKLKEQSGVRCIAFSPDGEIIAAIYGEIEIKLWNKHGRELKTLGPIYNQRAITGIAISPDGKYIVIGTRLGVLICLDIKSGFQTWSSRVAELSIENFAFSPDGKYIVADTCRNVVKLLKSQDGKLVRTFSTPPTDRCDFSFTPDSKYFITATDTIFIKWNIQTGQIAKSYTGVNGKGNHVTISPDGKTIASNEEYTDHVKLWDVKSGIEIKAINSNKKYGSVWKFSPDNKTIAIVGNDSIKIINFQTGQESKPLIGNFRFVYDLAFNPDGKIIAFFKDNNGTIRIWDIQKGKQIKSLTGPNPWWFSKAIFFSPAIGFSPDGKTIAVGTHNSIQLWDIPSGQVIQTISGTFKFVRDLTFSPDGKTIVWGADDKTVRIWDIQKKRQIKTLQGLNTFTYKVVISPDGKTIAAGSIDGAIKFWSKTKGKPLLTLFRFKDSDDFIVYSPDGRFDGTKRGMEALYYVEGVNVIPLESLYEQYYTPNLLARVLAGEEINKPVINIEDLQLPPTVEIFSPNDNSKVHHDNLEVSLSVKVQSGGVNEIRLYLNDKLIESTQRGFKPGIQERDTIIKTYTISLINGENRIKATAFNNQRTEAIPDEITVFYNGIKKTANLHMLIVGIDNYKNPNYKLNYALADANAFKEVIENGSKDIFESVNVTFVNDTDASRSNIFMKFNKLKSYIKQEDVFIFYYAGHGVMSEEDRTQFYIIPYDVTQLYGDNELLNSKAISANELQILSTEIKAQKQMFVFDACQSGGMTELLASRGMAKEKAIAQLARSTGTYWLAASNSEQFVTEFSELGHALFTYTLLLGLKGEADGGSKDKRITVEELSAFIKNKLPELSKKHKGTPQYPTSYGYGQDFPIIIVE